MTNCWILKSDSLHRQSSQLQLQLQQPHWIINIALVSFKFHSTIENRSHEHLRFVFHLSDSDAIIISDESESKTDKASDDSNHNNTENGESKVIDEIESKENNANGVVVVVKEENQNTVDIYNDNIDDDDDNEKNMKIFRNVIGELKGVYNEFLAQMKLVQKDLIRAAKYDELESKVIGYSSGIFPDSFINSFFFSFI